MTYFHQDVTVRSLKIIEILHTCQFRKSFQRGYDMCSERVNKLNKHIEIQLEKAKTTFQIKRKLYLLSYRPSNQLNFHFSPLINEFVNTLTRTAHRHKNYPTSTKRFESIYEELRSEVQF